MDGAADDEHSVSTASSAYTQEASHTVVVRNLEVARADGKRPPRCLPVVETVVSDEEPTDSE
jgi:hypothetical protein